MLKSHNSAVLFPHIDLPRTLSPVVGTDRNAKKGEMIMLVNVAETHASEAGGGVIGDST